MGDEMAFAAGMDLAGELVGRLGVTDPHLLWEAARLMEARADSALEMGAAAGLRIIASEIADDRLNVPIPIR